MKKLYTMLLLAVTLTSAGQNLILNGSDWTDSNSDGLADFWQSGTGTTNWIEEGKQYSTFQSGSYLEQPVFVPADGKPYVVECDIYSHNATTYIHIGILSGISFVVTSIPPGNTVHVYSVFINQDGISAIKFMSTQPGGSWVDNVQLYKYVPVGVEEKQVHSGPVRYYDMLGREVPQPERGFYIRRTENGSKVCYKTN